MIRGSTWSAPSYWLTNTTTSAARLYWESKLAFFAPKHVAIPVAVTALPNELYQAPRSWAERTYLKLIHYHKADKGRCAAGWRAVARLIGAESVSCARLLAVDAHGETAQPRLVPRLTLA
jgi:hypothetical protein